MGCAGQINPQRGWKRSYGARRTSRLYLRSSARRRPLLLPRHPPQFNPPQFNPPLLRLCSPIQPKLHSSARGGVSEKKRGGARSSRNRKNSAEGSNSWLNGNGSSNWPSSNGRNRKKPSSARRYRHNNRHNNRHSSGQRNRQKKKRKLSSSGARVWKRLRRPQAQRRATQEAPAPARVRAEACRARLAMRARYGSASNPIWFLILKRSAEPRKPLSLFSARRTARSCMRILRAQAVSPPGMMPCCARCENPTPCRGIRMAARRAVLRLHFAPKIKSAQVIMEMNGKTSNTPERMRKASSMTIRSHSSSAGSQAKKAGSEASRTKPSPTQPQALIWSDI